jgi:transposase-like protein
MESGFKTLREAIIHFADFENCKALMMKLRWPDGVVKCPRCGSDHVVYLAKNRVWKCYGKHERPTFSLKTGTIFEESPIGLEKWLPALWQLINCKNGISSCETAREMGVTQKSAWFMNHRLRFALTDGGSGLLSGEVEADETFIGQKARNMHKDVRARKITGTGGKDKTAVMGILERGRDGKSSKVRTTVVANRRKNALQTEVRKHVQAGSAIYTDALKSYEGLDEFEHGVVDHAIQ